METKPDKQQTVTRLALCVVVAVALYAAAGKVPPLEPYRPWLEEHKVQAIAITAAILFGLSLLLFPPEEGGAEPAAPEEGPCAGYERTARRRIERFCGGLFSAHGDNYEGNCREI